MVKKILLCTLVGTAAYLLVGWFVFDFLLGNYTEANTTHIPGFKKTEAEFSYALLLLSCAAYSALMTYILVYLLDIKTLLKSFGISALIGLFIAIMTDTYWLASSHFYLNEMVLVLDIVAAGLSVGVLGVVITLVNKSWHR